MKKLTRDIVSLISNTADEAKEKKEVVFPS